MPYASEMFFLSAFVSPGKALERKREEGTEMGTVKKQSEQTKQTEL